MEDKQYKVNSVDLEQGVSFDYQVHGTPFTHTIFLDDYTESAITKAIEEYVLSEDERLAEQNSIPQDGEDLIDVVSEVE